MVKSPTQLQPIEVVCHRTQTTQQRLAMSMMQLDMALALAREKGRGDIELFLEGELSKIRKARERALQ